MGRKQKVVRDLMEELLTPGKGARAGDVGKTMLELQRESGLSKEAILTKLRTLKVAGHLVCVRKLIEAIDGRPVLVPTYKLKP